MKKSSLILCSALALSGCMFGFDPDVDSAAETRAEHHEAYRQEFGCPLTDDHEAYRTCLVNTYKNTHPKTYMLEQAENGKSVAVIKNETKTSYDKDTDTYRTERVIVIETEERLVPVPAPVMPVENIKPVEPTPDVDLVDIDDPCDDDEVVGFIDDLETKSQSATPPPPTVKPEPTTWWDTYQKDKDTAPAAKKPVCPCADPNDPCPQCVDK